MTSESSTEMDNDLLTRLEQEFTTDEQQQFLQHFKLYLSSKNRHICFAVKFEDVWKWLGISRKDSAKRTLVNNFIENVEYIIEQNKSSISDKRGGHNNEEIYMTVETFKAFCMMANTDKGKATRRYYSKMENIFFEYIHKKYDTTIETLENKFIQLKQKNAHEIERKLIASHKMTSVLYIVVVEEIDDNTFIIKFGYTDDIETRMIAHHGDYKGCFLIDVFPCVRAHRCEQYILHRRDVLDHRIGNTELIKLSSEFPYNKFQKIVKKSVTNFDHFDKETQRMKHEQQILNAIKEAETPEQKEALYGLIRNCWETKRDEGKCFADSDDEDEVKDPRYFNRCVFKYDPTDLQNPVSIYYSLRAAARSLGRSDIYDYHIRQASINNTILCDYRWYYTDEEGGSPDVIPPTAEEVNTQTRRQGLVAQISPDKTKILHVFTNQRDAEKKTKITNCQINTGISTGNMRNGYYWKMYDNCSQELKDTYEGELPRPAKKVGPSSKLVERIDPDTDEVLESYNSMSAVCNEYKCCHKSIHIANSTGDIFKGFKWRIVG